MGSKVFEKIKKIPIVRALYRNRFLSGVYHYALVFLGALRYGFPGKRLFVIGVTGTKGKTTTCNLITHILNTAGYKTGMATTVNFRIGDKEWENRTKQTMLGRFALQGLLARMAREGCRYAVVETSSEGILQHRNEFISYRVGVFTNISPEHIERHGSFENYRAAKVKLFKQVAKRKDSAGIYNMDDENVSFFLKPLVSHKVGYFKNISQIPDGIAPYKISDIELSISGSSFTLNGERYEIPLVGEFNVYNAAAAICAAIACGVSISKIKESLVTARPAPGRLETLKAANGATIIIDYAHEPASLTALYKAARLFEPDKLIGLLGSQGGGRDSWKRETMGKIAGEFCDYVVISNEDPYDEAPRQIIEGIKKGVLESKIAPGNVFSIPDRKEGIRKAVSLAGPNDVVVLSGKGGEVWMCVEDGKKISWKEREVVDEIVGSGK
jgi:UDP-N-acetylmuramoyl-L-alanyl-D-glutamate--2,6-diaminopimelate ligase